MPDLTNAGQVISQREAAPARGISLASIQDFPDRLSPMIVKELRRGLRSPLFVWAFLGMHLVLTFAVLASFGPQMTRTATMLFWMTMVLPSFILPLRGFNALNEEQRQHTQDTLILTHLGALRITVGKWFCIAAQIVLIASTVLPYLVMRYFAGAVDVALELRLLAHLTMLGLVFAAGIVGFSWMPHFFMRGLTTLALGFLMVRGFLWSFSMMRSAQALVVPEYQELILTIGGYVLAAFAIYYLLGFAASQISHSSENHSSMRRLASLIMMLVFCGIAIWCSEMSYGKLCLNAAFAIAILAGIEAATERPRHSVAICEPFVKFGWFGRLAGRLFYPGWHSGILFFLLLGVLYACSRYFYLQQARAPLSTGTGPSALYKLYSHVYPVDNSWFWQDQAERFLTYFGQILFGLLLMRFFFRKNRHPFPLFLLLQFGLGLLQGLLYFFSLTTRLPALNLLAFPSPVSHAVYSEALKVVARRRTSPGGDARGMDLEAWLPLTGSLVLAYIVILLILAIREFRHTREMEWQTLRMRTVKDNHD